jgi:hypothetical protein
MKTFTVADTRRGNLVKEIASLTELLEVDERVTPAITPFVNDDESFCRKEYLPGAFPDILSFGGASSNPTGNICTQ